MSKLTFALTLVLMLGVRGGGAEQLKAAAPQQGQADLQEEPLPPGAVARLGTLRFRHSDSINHIAIGTDGTSILSAAGKIVYI